MQVQLLFAAHQIRVGSLCHSGKECVILGTVQNQQVAAGGFVYDHNLQIGRADAGGGSQHLADGVHQSVRVHRRLDQGDLIAGLDCHTLLRRRSLCLDGIALLLQGNQQRGFQTQAVLAGVDDQTRSVGVFGSHSDDVVKAQHNDLLPGLGFPCVYGVPVAEGKIVMLALGAVDHHKADLGILGQLHATVSGGLGGGLSLQVKHGRHQQRRAHQLIDDNVQVLGIVFRLQRGDGVLYLGVEGGGFLLFLFGHSSDSSIHFNFMAFTASRR